MDWLYVYITTVEILRLTVSCQYLRQDWKITKYFSANLHPKNSTRLNITTWTSPWSMLYPGYNAAIVFKSQLLWVSLVAPVWLLLKDGHHWSGTSVSGGLLFPLVVSIHCGGDGMLATYTTWQPHALDMSHIHCLNYFVLMLEFLVSPNHETILSSKFVQFKVVVSITHNWWYPGTNIGEGCWRTAYTSWSIVSEQKSLSKYQWCGHGLANTAASLSPC